MCPQALSATGVPACRSWCACLPSYQGCPQSAAAPRRTDQKCLVSMGKHAVKTRIWKLTEINVGWGRGERQRGKLKRTERRGSRSAEEIVLAWWPEAFRLSGRHYLAFPSARSSALVLKCREVQNTHAYAARHRGGPDPCVHHTHTHANTPTSVCFRLCVFLITSMNLCIQWSAGLVLVVYCNAPDLLFVSMDNSISFIAGGHTA